VLAFLEPGRDAQVERLAHASVSGHLETIAPELMWSEATAILHLRLVQRRLNPGDALARLADLERLPIAPDQPPGLRRRAWDIADRMGWGRTYDAEYCALAEMRDGQVVTADGRLRRAAQGRLDYVIGLDELVEALPA
jgi:predicted nucleic acid-binding protein